MRGLLYYDLRNIRRTLLLFLIPALILCFFLPRDGIAHLITVCFLTSGYITLPFDRKEPWFRYQLTLPLGRRGLAAEKCLLVVLVTFMSLLLGLILASVFPSDTARADILGVVLSFLLLICAALPISSALDHPDLLLLLVLGPFLTMVQSYAHTVPPHLSVLALLIGGPIALFLSYRWTCAVLENNDF